MVPSLCSDVLWLVIAPLAVSSIPFMSYYVLFVYFWMKYFTGGAVICGFS